MDFVKDPMRYAMQAYDSPHCTTIGEFNKDYRRFITFKKAIKRDLTDAKIHGLLNQVISLYNVFSCTECTKLLFRHVDKEYWFRLKPICDFLHTMPDTIVELGLIKEEVKSCQQVLNVLEKI